MSTTEEFEFTFAMRQYPFYREGMTYEEWKEERDYRAEHIMDVPKGKYKPLWKQREDGNKN